MSKPEPVFPNGLIVKRREDAPSFVIANLSFKVDDFTKWMNENAANGWVNVQALVSKGGKPYAVLDTWDPDKNKAGESSTPAPSSNVPSASPNGSYKAEAESDIPF